MLTKRIIPCLDVKAGRVVKGTSFIKLRDAGDPVELARFYSEEGADELVFLDIEATPSERNIMADVVERISQEVFIPLTVGGRLRSSDDIQRILRAGADKISMNTAAVLNPGLISEGAREFGSQCIVVAIDAIDWARQAVELGAGEILLTSLDSDGHRAGYDIELTRAVSEVVSVPVIASGGAGQLEDLYQALTLGEADAVLAASIFHYGTYSMAETKRYLAKRGIPVRL